MTVTFESYQPEDIRVHAPLAPRQQPADLGHCRIELDRPSNFMDAVGWFQAVADTPGSTVRIISSILYGIKPDGSLEVIGGGVDWAGLYSRDPWFPPGDRHISLGPSDHYIIPTGRDLIHGGSSHGSLHGYTDAIYVVVVETTGDARVQVGIDYRPRADIPVVRERALSDWFRGDGRTLHSTPDPRTPATPNCLPTFHTAVIQTRR